MKISVSITTYNHERYIGQAVESVLSQQCRARVEVVVGDDCSTDGTSDILAQLEREHRGSLKVIRPATNLGQQGRAMFLETLKHCDGAFVAMLDGDDYWTDDAKLERQIEFMTRHEDCSLCHHPVENVYDNGSTEPWRDDAGGAESLVGFDALLPWHSIGSPTPLVRHKVVRAIPAWMSRSPFGDWPIYLAAADIGRIGYLPQVMAAYRFHERGVWTQTTDLDRQQQVVDFFAGIDGRILRRHARALLLAMGFQLLELAEKHRNQGMLVDRGGCPVEWLGTEGMAGSTVDDALQPSEEFSLAVVRLLNAIGGDLLARNRRSVARVLSLHTLLLARRSLERGLCRPALHMVRQSLRAEPGTTLLLAPTLVRERMAGWRPVHVR
jgi:glycosyltransferase involved in cell wall biosynthesis